MFAALLLCLVPTLVVGQFPFETPVKCGQECVEKYSSGEQSACIRGCAISYVTKKHSGENFPTCEQTCAKEFEKAIEYVEVCKKACATTPEPLVHINKPLSPFEWIRNLLSKAFNKAKNCMKLFRGSTEQTPIKSDAPADNTKKDEEEHPFFITRIRVFQRIIPDDSANNQDLMNPLMPMHHMMMQDGPKEADGKSYPALESQNPDHMVRVMWSNEDSKPDHPMMQYIGSARMTSLFKHIVVSPLILSLFVILLLLVSLITIKLVVQACHYRDVRRIQYSRLPTYIEAVSVKIPYSDDEETMEKKKPVDA